MLVLMDLFAMIFETPRRHQEPHIPPFRATGQLCSWRSGGYWKPRRTIQQNHQGIYCNPTWEKGMCTADVMHSEHPGIYRESPSKQAATNPLRVINPVFPVSSHRAMTRSASLPPVQFEYGLPTEKIIGKDQGAMHSCMLMSFQEDRMKGSRSASELGSTSAYASDHSDNDSLVPKSDASPFTADNQSAGPSSEDESVATVLGDNLNETKQSIEPSPRLSNLLKAYPLLAAEESVEKARTLTRQAHGLGSRVNGEIRSLQNEMADLTNELAVLQQEVLHKKSPPSGHSPFSSPMFSAHR